MKWFPLLAVLCAVLFPAAAKAGETVTYKDGDTVLEGYVAKPANTTGKAPVVMIAHQWMGLTANEKMRADMLAQQGYIAFAIDMYGQGIRPKDTKEAGELATKYKSDAATSRRRLNNALVYARQIEGADPARVAIIGYCFGGTMALELARSGADILGAVSFHGGLSTPDPVTKPGVIKASIQVHHGADDPMVKPEEVAAFEKEMNAAGADWVLTKYAHAVHAFTQKEAGEDPSKGIAYNAKADARSWAYALDFLEKLF